MHANAESSLLQPLQGLIQFGDFNIQPQGQGLHHFVVLSPQKQLLNIFGYRFAGRLEVRACPLAVSQQFFFERQQVSAKVVGHGCAPAAGRQKNSGAP
jgi:hypothetical protein